MQELFRLLLCPNVYKNDIVWAWTETERLMPNVYVDVLRKTNYKQNFSI